MIFIIGGYAQGQIEYARANYKEEDIICYDVNELLKDESVSVQDAFSSIMNKADDNSLVISTEIGNGIVPVDAYERDYRERVGRLQVMLANNSKTVIRLVCGIAQIIKG